MKEKEFLDDFAKRLRQKMLSANINQVELVKKSWLSRSTIHRCLRGEKMPTLDTYVNLVVSLDIDPRELANLYWRID